MKTKVTNHANTRMKERLGIKSAKRRARMATLALERGKVVEIEEREYLGLSQTRMVLEYQEGLFVFTPDLSLVTVLDSKRKKYMNRIKTLDRINHNESKQAMLYA